MTLTFCGGARTVTGSCALMETRNSKILVDCGLYQGGGFARKHNYAPFEFDPTKIDACLVTHAHIDHTGRLPKLTKEGFTGNIYSTHPTKDFARLLLGDSMEILAGRALRQEREPVYHKKDVKHTFSVWQTKGYGEKFEVCKGVQARFRNAGHILGSASIEIWLKDSKRKDPIKLVFSGDLGNYPVPILSPPAEIDSADYVVAESTYGDREHENVKRRRGILEDVIENTVTRKGALMIPAFALERTQEVLYELNLLVENHRVPQVPIYLDSPLAIQLTQVYKKHQDYYNKKALRLLEKGDKIFDFPQLTLTKTVAESKKINATPEPKVIIAGSGMSTGGRILHHEKRYLPGTENTLLIISYQVPGTLGRKILDGESPVEIMGDKIPVRARVKAVGGYSSHADQPRLMQWLAHFDKARLQKCFINHGEQDQAFALSQKIKDHLGVSTKVPHMGDKFVL